MIKKTAFAIGLVVVFILTGSIVLADSISRPYPDFQAGTPAVADQVDANFDTVYEQVNKIGSVINIDDINSRVGIGTTTPTAPFVIHHNGSCTSPIYSPGTIAGFVANWGVDNWSQIAIIGGNSGRSTINFGDINDDNVGSIQYSHASDTMWFNTNGVNRMLISSDGNVGIGTSSPLLPLDIRGATIINTDTPEVGTSVAVSVLHLYKAGETVLGSGNQLLIGSANSTSSYAQIGLGWTRQTMTYAPSVIGYKPSVDTNYTKGDLFFATRDVITDSQPSIRMIIRASGRVGIGTLIPQGELDVNGTAYCSSGIWTGSDIRWKKNIKPLNGALEKINRLKGVNFEWKREDYPEKRFDEGVSIGFVAQDVEPVIPEVVRTDDNGYKSVSYEKLTAVLVEAMKEQQAHIQTLEKQNEALQHALEEITARMNALEDKKDM